MTTIETKDVLEYLKAALDRITMGELESETVIRRAIWMLEEAVKDDYKR